MSWVVVCGCRPVQLPSKYRERFCGIHEGISNEGPDGDDEAHAADKQLLEEPLDSYLFGCEELFNVCTSHHVWGAVPLAMCRYLCRICMMFLYLQHRH